MEKKLGRGLSALFGNDTNNADPDSDCLGKKTEAFDLVNQKTDIVTADAQRLSNNTGTPIVPARNEEAIEIATHIERAIHLPTSLQITRKGGKLIIKCKTYEELEILVKKLTADD